MCVGVHVSYEKSCSRYCLIFWLIALENIFYFLLHHRDKLK